MTASHRIIFDPELTITWTSGTNITGCGQLIEEIYDVTTGVEQAIDPNIFSFDGASSELRIDPQDLKLAGVYDLKLKFYNSATPSIFAESVFRIELLDPCASVTL